MSDQTIPDASLTTPVVALSPGPAPWVAPAQRVSSLRQKPLPNEPIAIPYEDFKKLEESASLSSHVARQFKTKPDQKQEARLKSHTESSPMVIRRRGVLQAFKEAHGTHGAQTFHLINPAVIDEAVGPSGANEKLVCQRIRDNKDLLQVRSGKLRAAHGLDPWQRVHIRQLVGLMLVRGWNPRTEIKPTKDRLIEAMVAANESMQSQDDAYKHAKKYGRGPDEHISKSEIASEHDKLMHRHNQRVEQVAEAAKRHAGKLDPAQVEAKDHLLHTAEHLAHMDVDLTGVRTSGTIWPRGAVTRAAALFGQALQVTSDKEAAKAVLKQVLDGGARTVHLKAKPAA